MTSCTSTTSTTSITSITSTTKTPDRTGNAVTAGNAPNVDAAGSPNPVRGATATKGSWACQQTANPRPTIARANHAAAAVAAPRPAPCTADAGADRSAKDRNGRIAPGAA